LLRCAWSTDNVLEKRRGTEDPNGRATARAALHETDATALAATVEKSGLRSDKPLLHGEITSSIIDSFFEVHGELGFGFREYIYARVLERLLIQKGHKVDREVAVMVYFRGELLAYERMDMVVDGKVIIENKTREPLDPDAQGQLFAGLAATNLEVGLVFHFERKRASAASSSRIGSSTATSSAAPAAVAPPFRTTRSLPLPEHVASVTASSLHVDSTHV